MPDTDTLDDKLRHIEATIETWFFESFQGSIVARSTETWNAVHAAKEELKTRLAALVSTPTNG